MKNPFISIAVLVIAVSVVADVSSGHAQSAGSNTANGAISGAASLPNSSDTIVPDRPDFTDGPVVVPLGRVQIESGLTQTRSGGAREFSLGELLVRVPFARKLEVRVGVPSFLRQRGDGSSASGADDSDLGFKLALSPGGHGRPATALLFDSSLPTGSRRIGEHTYQPEAKLSLEWDFSEALSLGVNLGYGRPSDSGQRFSQDFASASLGVSLTEKLGAYLEAYGFHHADASGENARFADTGLSYLVKPNLSLDARVGLGLANHAGGPEYFYGVGAARLF